MKQGLGEQGMYREQDKIHLVCPDHTEGNIFNCDSIELTFVKQSSLGCQIVRSGSKEDCKGPEIEKLITRGS